MSQASPRKHPAMKRRLHTAKTPYTRNTASRSLRLAGVTMVRTNSAPLEDILLLPAISGFENLPQLPVTRSQSLPSSTVSTEPKTVLKGRGPIDAPLPSTNPAGASFPLIRSGLSGNLDFLSLNPTSAMPEVTPATLHAPTTMASVLLNIPYMTDEVMSCRKLRAVALKCSVRGHVFMPSAMDGQVKHVFMLINAISQDSTREFIRRIHSVVGMSTHANTVVDMLCCDGVAATWLSLSSSLALAELVGRPASMEYVSSLCSWIRQNRPVEDAKKLIVGLLDFIDILN